MTDGDDPLTPLTGIEVGAPPPLTEVQTRHRRHARRRRAVSASIVAGAIAVGALVWVAPRHDPVDTVTAPATTTSTTSTTPVEPDASTGPVVEAEADIRFDVTPDQARPGDSVQISGNACPADASWDPGSPESSDHFVVIGAGVADGPRTPGIGTPSDEPGHVSFELVPEYREARIAQATPDDDGDWSATWTVPEPDPGSETVWLTALCIGGSGLEAGSVHYGAIPLRVLASDDATTTTAAGISRPLPTTLRPADDTTHDPTTCWLSWSGLAFYRADEGLDVDPPPCIRAGVTDRLRLGNLSGDTWTLDLGETTRSIPSGTFDDFESAPLGDFLEIGVHHLSDDLPDIWVVDPADSPFGAVTEITLRSYGPLRTNMTVAEAESVLGVDLVSTQENLGGCTFVAPAGPSDPYAPQLQVFGNDEDGRIVRIETYDPAVATPSGVRVGQPEATLTETYGAQLESSPDEYKGPENPNYEYVPVDSADADFRLMFSTLDDTIESIWTATTEAAYLAEGCS